MDTRCDGASQPCIVRDKGCSQAVAGMCCKALGFDRLQPRKVEPVRRNRKKNLRTLVHGDDYAAVGSLEGVRWLLKELESALEMKTSSMRDGSRVS